MPMTAAADLQPGDVMTDPWPRTVASVAVEGDVVTIEFEGDEHAEMTTAPESEFNVE